MSVGIYAGEMMARLSPLREIGPLPMDKTASIRWHLTPEEIERNAQRAKVLAAFVNNHSELIGAAVGAAYGGLLGGTSKRTDKEIAQDPRAPLRNRLGATLGGALGGALVGGLLRGTMGNPLGMANATQQMVAVGAQSANAGREVANLFAPQTLVPRTVSEILGKKQQYSDKALLEEYQNEFGNELKDKKMTLADKPREDKYVTALRDLYSTAATQPVSSVPPKSKKNYLLNAAAGVALAPVGVAARDMVMGRLYEMSDMTAPKITAKSVALQSIPSVVGTAARTAKGYRERYIDPGVTVENKADAEVRSKFDDGQLRRLLRGLKVEEVKVKQHVIK